MPASGKSTVGKSLAKRLAVPFVDSDEQIASRAGVSVANIFAVEGEAGFRLREEKTIAQLVEQTPIVLATGGGAILSATTRALLRDVGTVVYLHASIEELVRRTARDRKRPLLANGDAETTLRTLLLAREPLYRETAHFVVGSSAKSANRLADQIVHLLGNRHRQL